jgi:hypothetical protein
MEIMKEPVRRMTTVPMTIPAILVPITPLEAFTDAYMELLVWIGTDGISSLPATVELSLAEDMYST